MSPASIITTSPTASSAEGIRVGTPAGTTRGFKEKEFEQIGNWIADVVDALAQGNAEEVIVRIAGEVKDLCAKFPIYKR